MEDFDSGELALYENDCKTLNKKVKIVSNRLVIFQVGPNSFHEVCNCESEGRKAFSGWFNIKSKKADQPADFGSLSIPENIEFFDLPIDINEADIICLDFEDVEAKEINRSINGPLNDRRCTLIFLERFYVPNFDGYYLISVEYIQMNDLGYLLINDRINDDLEGLLDVFVFITGDYIENFISYVENNGEILEYLPTEYGKMIISKRNQRSIVIQRIRGQVCFKHFIYKKKAE